MSLSVPRGLDEAGFANKKCFSPQLQTCSVWGLCLFQPLSSNIKLMFVDAGKQKHTFQSLCGAAERSFPVPTAA